MNRPGSHIWISSTAYLAALITLTVSAARLGTPIFFVCVAVMVAAYGFILFTAWRTPPRRRSLFLVAMLFAVAFRIPVAVPEVNFDNDMIRYVWDGRVQKLGINPYAVRPADEAVAFTHNDETRRMPSARHKTPYPPAAQLFFRLVVSLHDSGRAMKLALILCDLLTMLVVWRWVVATGRNEWLTLGYAWNPLVILEAGHSGHIDVLGALWIVTCAFWLTRRRTALATVAFVLAVTTKLLPIVLVPILWRRISLRDALLGVGLLVLLYLPFATGVDVLYGIHNVIQHVRFNGPVFRLLAYLLTPDGAARVALGLGLAAAAWCRWRLAADDPAAWAWPMALAIVFAPVIYPWYLVYFTPFLLLPTVLPLITWSCSVLMVYVVWQIVSAGGQWVVPIPVLVAEYGAVLAAAVATIWWARRPAVTAPEASRSTG